VIVKQKMLILYVLIFVAILFIFSAKPLEKDELEPITGVWDISASVSENNYGEFLEETIDFDYSDPAIYAKAQEIKGATSSAEEAIKKTIRFVADSTLYSSKITVNYCYNEKASDVLEIGRGDCVSMSRLSTALLRAQGIPARTMGGCLSAFKRCVPIFSTIPFLEAQVTDMEVNDFKKRGYLHEWVEAFDGEEWKLVEATSGQIYSLDCVTYLPYSYDKNQYDRCTISSSIFWNQCKLH